ncbi:MAG TPA: serine protease, partial [Longimicrobium sp.]|nr:serine protease [Longimicrobium sp.]
MGSQRKAQRNKGRTNSPAARGRPNGRREVFAWVRRAVVAIAAGPAHDPDNPLDAFNKLAILGSGFVVNSEKMIVVTAGHVVDPFIRAVNNAIASGAPAPPPPQVLFSGPMRNSQDGRAESVVHVAQVRRVQRSAHHDVAVLSVPVPEEADVLRDVSVIGLPLAERGCEEGDEVAICGYPLGRNLHADLLGANVPTFNPSFSQGIVSAVLPFSGAPLTARTHFQVDAMINPGNSGGAIFDPVTGHVWGVVSSATNRVFKALIQNPDGSNKVSDIEVPTGL